MSPLQACARAALLLGLIAHSAAALELNDCTLTGSRGLATIEARCGWFERPEDPTDPASATIRLRVAVVPSLSRTSQPDALTVINGGPGASSPVASGVSVDASAIYTPEPERISTRPAISRAIMASPTCPMVSAITKSTPELAAQLTCSLKMDLTALGILDHDIRIIRPGDTH